MYKKIYYGAEARQLIADGVDIVANAVKVTLGFMGRNVVIGRDGINPHITKDGVTVAKSIFIKDYASSIGANLIKEVAMKTVELAGDGTTTATILAQALINTSIQAINDGSNPVHLRQGLEQGINFCTEELNNFSKKVEDQDLVNIATISANNDIVLGELISQAFKEVGQYGIIKTEMSKSGESSLNFTKGFKIDQGFISPYFATKGRCVLIDPYILLIDGRVDNFSQIQTFVEKCSQTKKALLIVCEGVDENTLEILTHNHQNKAIQCCVVKSEGYGEDRITLLQDLRHSVGGVIYGKTTALSQINTEQLGRAGTVIVTNYSTEIIDGRLGDKYKDEIIKELHDKLDSTLDNWEKDALKKRLGNLQAKVAIIRIGGFTDTEQKEMYDRIDDSIQACRAAMLEGYVMGGGSTYLFLSQRLQQYYESLDLNPGQLHGFILLSEALYMPFCQNLVNAGLTDLQINEKVVDVINLGYGLGVDLRTLTIEKLYDKGVLDPTKVLRIALESSGSVACTLLTTECLISEDPE